MQLRKEENKKFNTTIKCPLPRIIYSTLSSLSNFNNQNITNYHPNTITNYKPSSNINNTNYMSPNVNTNTNYKKSNMLPSLMASSKFSNSGEILARSKKLNKNAKSQKSQNYLNNFKDVLKYFGLSKYYEKMIELGINDNTYINLGLMTRKNINELINNLNIFPGHIIKFEKLYEYLRNETFNEENNNNLKTNNKINNNINNNKNAVNYVSLNFNYNEENNEINNKIKHDHSHSLCKYKFINSTMRPHLTSLKENFLEASLNKNSNANKSVNKITHIKKIKKNSKKNNKGNKIGLNNLLLKNFVKEKSNNSDSKSSFTYNSYIQNLINAYNNSQTEKSRTIDNSKGNIETENKNISNNYYSNNLNANSCTELQNSKLIPIPIMKKNENAIKLPNIINKTEVSMKNRSKKTPKAESRNNIKNSINITDSNEENNDNKNENINNEINNFTNRTGNRKDIKIIGEKNNNGDIIDAETYEEKPMIKLRGRRDIKIENKNNDNDNINNNPSTNINDKNINTENYQNSNNNQNKFSLEDLIYESCRINRSFSEDTQQRDVIQFDTEYICRCLSLSILLLIESSKDKQHITELSKEETFKFLKPEYNSNINIVLDLFNTENNSKMLTQTLISNLDKLNSILNKNDPINEDINILKHIKKINDEELIKNEEEKSNGVPHIQVKENYKFRGGIGEVERDIKFIDEFFSPNKKKVINYQHISETSKNVLCKELSYINELDSELNKTNSVVNNDNNDKTGINNVSEINFSQKDINSPIKVGNENDDNINNLNINNDEYKDTIQNAEDDNFNGCEGDNELDIITECIGGRTENKDNLNNNNNEINLNNDNTNINTINITLNNTNNNTNNSIDNNINNDTLENNPNIKKVDISLKDIPNDDNNISNPEKNKNNNIETNQNISDEKTKINFSTQTNVTNINQKIKIKEYSNNINNIVPLQNNNKNNEHEEIEIVESDYIIDIDTVEKLKNYFLRQSEIFDDNFNYNLMQVVSRKYITAPDPQIIFDFCADILVLTKMEKEVLILSLIYLERFIFNTGVLLTSRNWRRMLFIALIIASKIWDDNSFENKHFAQIFSTLKVGEINLLEGVFMNLINYNVFVSQKEYFEYLFMIKSLALKYNYNGRNIIPVSIEGSLRLQEYAEEMQNRMRRKVTLNNSAQF